MRTQRQLKVGEELRHALSMLFQRGDVPWPANYKPPMITISEVQVSPDLKNSTAYFTVVEEDAAHDAEKQLNNIAGFFRHHISKTVRLRFTPRLNFKFDTSFTYASNIERILQDPKVAKDVAKPSEEKQEEG